MFSYNYKLKSNVFKFPKFSKICILEINTLWNEKNITDHKFKFVFEDLRLFQSTNEVPANNRVLKLLYLWKYQT